MQNTNKTSKEKQCNNCKQTKPLKDFWRHNVYKDGRWAECAECCKVKKRKYKFGFLRKNPDTINKFKKPIVGNTQKRICLGVFCRGERYFISTHIGERICKRCKHSGERNYEDDLLGGVLFRRTVQ